MLDIFADEIEAAVVVSVTHRDLIYRVKDIAAKMRQADCNCNTVSVNQQIDKVESGASFTGVKIDFLG